MRTKEVFGQWSDLGVVICGQTRHVHIRDIVSAGMAGTCVISILKRIALLVGALGCVRIEKCLEAYAQGRVYF